MKPQTSFAPAFKHRSRPFKALSSTMQLHSVTSASQALTSSMPAQSVPPVATRSSIRITLSPGT
eukprot:CAMPEP_0180568754 /NCGR_PEP_ID=MMETSP1037_2-20121125/7323_1 /TAXON_ID=632150 /ORGANISM="Azadinium spinosum, Strain 3D9" /LENGTH=63 /DNA_ID=CAMNT_0022585963 /DNA_START=64 /DNA_END=252 /DNA_ORIENTATION=+